MTEPEQASWGKRPDSQQPLAGGKVSMWEAILCWLLFLVLIIGAGAIIAAWFCHD